MRPFKDVLKKTALKATQLILIACAVPVAGHAEAGSTGGKLCEHRATRDVRMLKECPPGTREVFAMERSVGGGFLMPSGRWIGPVAPRKDESPQRFRSQQDQAAHEDLLRRIPDAR